MKKTMQGFLLFEALLIAAFISLPASAATDVTVGDNFYSPVSVSVTAGSTVKWTSAGANPHTVTADGGSFASDTMNTGDTFQHTFNSPGTFPYHCKVHGSSMAGTITVTGSNPAPSASPTTKKSASPTPRPRATRTASAAPAASKSPTASPTPSAHLSASPSVDPSAPEPATDATPTVLAAPEESTGGRAPIVPVALGLALAGLAGFVYLKFVRTP
ncbi:MAG: cupredoxin domain-containing protein [Actinobacteria bacterium]|nr:cupredoxin domain-containing protein [Actinomycetota bacterium]